MRMLDGFEGAADLTGDLVKGMNVQKIERRGFRSPAGEGRVLARAQNLPAHEHGVAVRE